MAHKICITSNKQYADAVGALMDVGGWFHRVHSPNKGERVLFVNATQYEALVQRNIIQPNGQKGSKYGNKTNKKKR